MNGNGDRDAGAEMVDTRAGKSAKVGVGADVATRKCFGFNQDLAKVEFSKRQWVKRVGRECKACVIGRVEAEKKLERLSKTYTEMLSRNCGLWLKWHGVPGREPPTSMELSVFSRISQEDWRIILEGKELGAWPAVELSIHKQASAVAVAMKGLLIPMPRLPL